MILRIRVDANDEGQRILQELTASLEMKEMFVERLEHHIGAAVSDAVFDILGKEPCDYDVTIDGDTVPGLVLAMQAALHTVEQGKGNELKHLLTAAIARATNGAGGL